MLKQKSHPRLVSHLLNSLYTKMSNLNVYENVTH